MYRTSMRRFALLTVVTLTVGLAACGDDGAKETTNKSALAGKTLKVCTHVPYDPMAIKGDGPRGLKYKGFEIEILDAMAKVSGAKLSVKDDPYEGMEARLDKGQCDVVAASYLITAERRDLVDFTDPYFDADQSLLIRLDYDGFNIEDLKGRPIGVIKNSTGLAWLKGHLPEGATIEQYDSSDELVNAIGLGHIDGIVQDLAQNVGIVNHNPTLELIQRFSTADQYGFAVAQGSPLTADLNEALQLIRDEGTYNKVYF
jgi:polar amino acid transport system substrate-binding protein